MLSEILIVLSIGVLGIFLGAQITEGVLLVPYWKTLSPAAFFELHQTFGRKIHQFYAPLTILATFLPLTTVVFGLVTNVQGQLPLILMGIATAIFFSTYFLYFKQANGRFAEASIPHEKLSVELTKWGNWHWGRIVFESIAFVCSIVTLFCF